jgi:glutaredoxin-related protein
MILNSKCADCFQFSEKLNDLEINYFVLKENEELQKQFQQTIPIFAMF